MQEYEDDYLDVQYEEFDDDDIDDGVEMQFLRSSLLYSAFNFIRPLNTFN